MIVPTLIFTVPALLGHPAIAQDNFIQNFPLRVLSARQIAGGHLPLYNPLADSGSPLLGGMNAGSFYPLSLIFVFLPPLVAWVINMIAVYVTAAIGVYSLCRWLGLRSSAALIACVSYAYAGTMMGQMVHLGVIQGYSLLPWLILTELVAARSLLGVGDEQSWRRHVLESVPAVLGLGVLWALIFLSGEPRAIAEAELVTIVVLVVELIMHTGVARATWRGRGVFVGANVVGAAWGAAMAAAQLLPGWAFIQQSERASVGYGFFGSGSLEVRWTVLLFDQDLFGGNGVAGTPHFFSGYNLPEVTGYVGIVAVAAVFAFFVQLTRRGWRGEHRVFAVFGVLVVVGLFASWGYFTVVGHLFHLLPLFGKTRLQSRNLVLVDLGGAVLLGWWLDAVFARRMRAASLEGWRRWVTAAPAMIVVVLTISTLTAPAFVEGLFRSSSFPQFGGQEKLSLSLHLAVAIGVLAVLFGAFSRRHTNRWLIGLIVVDLLVFSMFADEGFGTGSTSTMPSRSVALAVLGDKGRYAIVDRSQDNFNVLEELGVPNLNVFTQLSSVQGYGSLISAMYSNVTGTHPLVALNYCSLLAGEFQQLRLDTLVLSSSSLSYVSGQPNYLPACGPPQRAPSVSRFFGSNLDLSQITLRDTVSSAAASAPLTVQLFGDHGQLVGAPITTRNTSRVIIGISHEPDASGFTVSAPGGVMVDFASVRADIAGVSTSLGLNGGYQQVVDSSQWTLGSTTFAYSVFKATNLLPPQWIEGAGPASRVLSSRTTSWGDEYLTVTTNKPVTMVRSVAFLTGWRATLVNTTTSQTVNATVHRDGLIQSIDVPTGTWRIHFHYHAPYVELGLIVSALSSLLFLFATFFVARPRYRIWRAGRVHG